jgi:dTDP-L-rhamnose 4-epimerase
MAFYLVTGGAGFIGSHIVDALLCKGHRVRILDNLQPRVHPKGRPPYVPADAEFIHGDVRDERVLAAALKGAEGVFHLAAYQDYMPDFSTFLHVNAVSPALILEIIARDRLDLRKIVFASTQAVYGEGKYLCPAHGAFYPGPRSLEQLERGGWEMRCPRCGIEAEWRPTDESAVSPHTAYAIAKYCSELTFLNLGRRCGIPSVGLRYSITQGPRNSFYNAYSGVCRIFSQRILSGERPIVFEDGRQLRDYINVEDVVRANILAMERSEADYGIFNVGGGKPISVMEFLTALAKVFGKGVEPIVSGEFRFGDTRHTVSDIGAMRGLGWEPKVPLEESLARYVEWLLAQPDARGHRYLEADNEMRGAGVIRKARTP